MPVRKAGKGVYVTKVSQSELCNQKENCVHTLIADIDECSEGTARCQHICTNYDGGFNCSCYSGYAINDDLKTCSGIIAKLDI